MRILIFTFLFALPQLILAQAKTNQEQFQIDIKRAKGAIKIDGSLEDAGWADAVLAKDFMEKFPRNETFAKTKTEVKITYDDDFLYIGAICYQSRPFIVTSLKREISLIDNDGLSIVLDPVNSKNNGFLFNVSAYGVQGDALISAADDDPNQNWDGRWFSEVKQSTDHYTVEMAIPFKTLRFEDNQLTWGLNFIRSNLQIGEFSTWAKVPLQFDGFNLGYMGRLNWDVAPKRQKRNISLIPYATAAYTKEENDNGTYDISRKPNAGFDAKIALNSSLNLDLTTNSDFSQADVDQLVTNLTRFNIFLPERRFFFLENSDVFSGFGIPPLRPFFSRTIGLDNEGLPVPILYGARLTGNATPTTRVGLMNVHTLGKNNANGQNVTVASIQQNIKGRSYSKALFLNRQGFDGSKSIEGDYARNVGLENVFTTEDGKISAWASGHLSFKPNIKRNNAFIDIGGMYSGENLFALLDYLPCQSDYYADQGFIERLENYDAARDTTIRLGYHGIYNEVNYSFYPKKENDWYQKIQIGYENYYVMNMDGSFNERRTDVNMGINFRNLYVAKLGVTNNSVNLPFATAFTDASPLPATGYTYTGAYLNLGTDRRKALSATVNVNGGGFYNGKIRSMTLSAIYRARPWGNFEANVQFNDLRFPEPYGKDILTLFGGKIEVNFSRNLFWTTFVQLNTQNNRFNFNSRLQWRFKPLSDVFLVYTDNYNIQDWQPKYRSLVFKVNYWLNL